MGRGADIDAVADDQLRAFFERWQRLEEEKTALSDDLKELFAEAKANGFDTKVLRAVFRDKTKDQAERAESEAIYDLYWSALGTPIATRAHPARTEPADPDPSGPAADPAPASNPPAAGADPFTQEGSEPIEAHNLDRAGSTPAPATPSTAPRKDVAQRDELAGPVQNQDGGSPAPQNDPAGGTVEVSAGMESAGVGRVEQPVASPRSNGSQAGTQAPPVDTNITPLHTGKISSTGMPRHDDCLNVDACAGTWRQSCHTCRKAAAARIQVEPGGAQVPHEGEVA